MGVDIAGEARQTCRRPWPSFPRRRRSCSVTAVARPAPSSRERVRSTTARMRLSFSRIAARTRSRGASSSRSFGMSGVQASLLERSPLLPVLRVPHPAEGSAQGPAAAAAPAPHGGRGGFSLGLVLGKPRVELTQHDVLAGHPRLDRRWISRSAIRCSISASGVGGSAPKYRSSAARVAEIFGGCAAIVEKNGSSKPSSVQLKVP